MFNLGGVYGKLLEVVSRRIPGAQTVRVWERGNHKLRIMERQRENENMQRKTGGEEEGPDHKRMNGTAEWRRDSMERRRGG
eukprot:765934-Hanusia_phi.AAC.2